MGIECFQFRDDCFISEEGKLFAFGNVEIGRFFLECLQHFFGALDHGIGKASKFCDVDAVAFIGSTLDDLAQKDNAAIGFMDGNVVD